MGNLVFQATLGGQVNLVGPNTASTFNINVPTVNGNMVTTGDTGTVTNTMLAGSIANAKLTNSSVTIGSTSVSLGATASTITGLTLTNPTINGFTGDTSVINVGSGQLYKDTSGNLGVGTTSPSTYSSRLVVESNGKNTGLVVGDLATPANATSIYLRTTGLASFYNAVGGSFSWGENGGSERMRLDASGNLGLGTTNPGILSYRVINAVGSGTSQGGLLNLDVSDGSATFRLYSNSSGATISMDDNLPMVFNTNGNERARIDSSGNFLVGTTSNPNSPKFRVNGIAAFGGSNTNIYQGELSSTATYIQSLTVGGSAADLVFYNTSERARIDSSGNFQCNNVVRANAGGGTSALVRQTGGATELSTFGLIVQKYDNNTTTSNYFVRFDINAGSAYSGAIAANGAGAAAFISYSDERLKENIQDLEPQLDKILALRPVTFDYKAGGSNTGFIAQNVQSVYPDSVGEDENGYLTLGGFSKTDARLIKAIQEQQAIITQLQADVAALKG